MRGKDGEGKDSRALFSRARNHVGLEFFAGWEGGLRRGRKSRTRAGPSCHRDLCSRRGRRKSQVVSPPSVAKSSAGQEEGKRVIEAHARGTFTRKCSREGGEECGPVDSAERERPRSHLRRSRAERGGERGVTTLPNISVPWRTREREGRARPVANCFRKLRERKIRRQAEHSNGLGRCKRRCRIVGVGGGKKKITADLHSASAVRIHSISIFVRTRKEGRAPTNDVALRPSFAENRKTFRLEEGGYSANRAPSPLLHAMLVGFGARRRFFAPSSLIFGVKGRGWKKNFPSPSALNVPEGGREEEGKKNGWRRKRGMPWTTSASEHRTLLPLRGRCE